MANDETIEYNGVKIPVGMNGIYFGAVDQDVPIMSNPKENGFIKDAEGNELVRFANVIHGMASLYLSRFSIAQIKKMYPQLEQVEPMDIIRVIHDTSSRRDRQQFIRNLDDNVPRTLNYGEMSALIKEFGFPAGRTKKINVHNILEQIKFDMENVDHIKPVGRSVSTRKPLTRDYITVKIGKLSRSSEKRTQNIANIEKRLAKISETLVNDPDDQNAIYQRGKLTQALDDNRIAFADISERIAMFTAKLDELPEETTSENITQ